MMWYIAPCHVSMPSRLVLSTLHIHVPFISQRECEIKTVQILTLAVILVMDGCVVNMIHCEIV